MKAVCPCCKGTGVYRDKDFPPGVAVICINCNGSGAVEVYVNPFVARQPVSGITTVYGRSRKYEPLNPESMITYEEFAAGKTPPFLPSVSDDE